MSFDRLLLVGVPVLVRAFRFSGVLARPTWPVREGQAGIEAKDTKESDMWLFLGGGLCWRAGRGWLFLDTLRAERAKVAIF